MSNQRGSVPWTPTLSNNRKPKQPQMKILIGVDFGTTYSGLAYVQTLEPAQRFLITDWGPGTATADKAPTVLAYDNQGVTGPFKWGYQVKSETKRHEWFKLGLEPTARFHNSDLASKYPNATAYPSVDPETSERLVIDYLTSLKNRAETYLGEYFGSRLVPTTPIEYIITVPAIWTDKAQFKTRECAEKAGLGDRDTIQVVSEPEAAGMYALESMSALNLAINDTFVVCDAGGGTVDLVSYTVKALKPSPVVVESAPGDGGLCGSTFLNRIFNRWIEKKFSKHKQWFEDEYHAQVIEWFEKEIKLAFLGDDQHDFETKVRGFPDNPSLGVTDRTFRITGKDLREKVFDPVIEQIQKLVLGQIKKTKEDVKKVLLCGGFGQSDYLKRRLQDVVGTEIEVLKVPNSNTAIVRGALIRGLAESSKIPNARVDSRMARRHFGICCYEPYDKAKHDESKREYHTYTGGYRVETMKWFVHKGETVKTGEPKTFGFYYDIPTTTGWSKTVDSEVFVHNGDEAPLYKTPGKSPNSSAWESRADLALAVKEAVKLKIDLSGIPDDEMIVRGQSGNMAHYKVDFDVEMILDSAKLSFSMFYKGKRHSTVHADFD